MVPNLVNNEMNIKANTKTNCLPFTYNKSTDALSNNAITTEVGKIAEFQIGFQISLQLIGHIPLLAHAAKDTAGISANQKFKKNRQGIEKTVSNMVIKAFGVHLRSQNCKRKPRMLFTPDQVF